MAQRIEALDVTVAAGTSSTAPQITALPWDEGEVEVIEVVVPDGCAGLVGFAFRHSQQQVIPFSAGAFVVSNDERIRWDVTGYPTGEKWEVSAYNTDVFPHTLHIRFLINELGAPTPQTPALLPIT